MDGVGTLGGGLGRLQCRELRAEMKVRGWRRRIMQQCEIGERNKDPLSFFQAHKKQSSQKKDLVIRRNKYVRVYLQNNRLTLSQSDQNAHAWQLDNPEFTICKLMIKTHIWGNFID
jgi:hypothetical protein